jgi:L-threonylcarbamoyladenylate synthase
MQRYKGNVIGKDIKNAADILKGGGIVVYPTETVYGIGANIFSEQALRKVFAKKKRNSDKPISIAVSSFEMMDELVIIGEKEQKFINKFLPGSVTVLLKKKKSFPHILTPGTDVVGIRYPGHRIAIELIERAGVPITSTSANFSGDQPPHSLDEIKISADYILDGGICNGEPSTVVDIFNMKIIRKGARYDEVQAALEEMQISD